MHAQQKHIMLGHSKSITCFSSPLYLASIPGRIKIRPGTYCMGDSAHALQITQNMGNCTTNVKP